MTFTIGQTFWIAVTVGAFGMGIGALFGLTYRLSRRRRPVEEMADPAYNPGLDHSERRLREVLDSEAERYPTSDVLDGMVGDYDTEQRRRGDR